MEDVKRVYSRLKGQDWICDADPEFSSFEFSRLEMPDLAHSFEISSFDVEICGHWDEGLAILGESTELFDEVALPFVVSRNASYKCRLARVREYERCAFAVRAGGVGKVELLDDLNAFFGRKIPKLLEEFDSRLQGEKELPEVVEDNGKKWLEVMDRSQIDSQVKNLGSLRGGFHYVAKFGDVDVVRTFRILLFEENIERRMLADCFETAGKIEDVSVLFSDVFVDAPSCLQAQGAAIDGLFPGVRKSVSVAGTPRHRFRLEDWEESRDCGYWQLFEFSLAGLDCWIGLHSESDGSWFEIGVETDSHDTKFDKIVSRIEGLFPGWDLIDLDPV